MPIGKCPEKIGLTTCCPSFAGYPFVEKILSQYFVGVNLGTFSTSMKRRNFYEKVPTQR
jgi:ribosomal protein S19